MGRDIEKKAVSKRETVYFLTYIIVLLKDGWADGWILLSAFYLGALVIHSGVSFNFIP